MLNFNFINLQKVIINKHTPPIVFLNQWFLLPSKLKTNLKSKNIQLSNPFQTISTTFVARNLFYQFKFKIK